MDIGTFIIQLYVPIIVVACLVVGYIVKMWIKDVDNKYIPTIVTILGALLGGITLGWTLQSIVAGAVSGLASTGLHQLFKQLIEGGSGLKGEVIEDD
jgi:hypothetical protein